VSEWPGVPPAVDGRPRLSVVVPAYRCAPMLRRSLAALRASDLPRERWELVVVDDGSEDETVDVARAAADRVVELGAGPRGPAYARNRGAEIARGDVLAFVDADVCVHADALRRMLGALADPSVGAVFGAYDAAPPAPGVVSRYANLHHRYVHLAGAGDAETFWAGCGAVRRHVFQSVGGFDARRYPRPQIEDVELGYRIRDHGWRILLRPEIQGTHLKRWTLWGLIVTGVRDRGVPWMELLLDEGVGTRAPTLSVSRAERRRTALAGFGGTAAVLAALWDARWLLASAGALALVLLSNAEMLWWLRRTGGRWLALAGAPLRILQYLVNLVAVAWTLLRRLRARRVKYRAQTPGDRATDAPPAGG
jgi:cellulose synthase/poly-beta-1,6-N-acetylglucosamine synthase-like glycosyltransferase